MTNASITIYSDKYSICTGTTVNFFAYAYKYTSPSYQWKLNGNNVGTNSGTWSYNSLANGNQINCVATQSGFPTLTSNTITMVVVQKVVPSTIISYMPNNLTFCDSDYISFYQTSSTNGGSGDGTRWGLVFIR